MAQNVFVSDWLMRLPCADCLHEAGVLCGMCGSASCSLREAAEESETLAPEWSRNRGGRMVCSAFSPAFIPADEEDCGASEAHDQLRDRRETAR